MDNVLILIKCVDFIASSRNKYIYMLQIQKCDEVGEADT